MFALITNRLANADGFTATRNPQGNTFYLASDGAAIDVVAAWDPCSQATLAEAAAQKPTVLFIHGFNNSWLKAMYTLQAIASGMGDGYTYAAFSWISEGRIDLGIGYEVDRAHARESAGDLANAITVLRSPSVVAHSMGNYVLQLALEQRARAGMVAAPLFLDNVMMVAADVDDTALLDPAFSTSGMIGRGTVLYCAMDGALGDSSLLHALELNGIPRLGLTGPLGRMPINFTKHDCTWPLLKVVNPIDKHGAYFREAFFYDLAKQFISQSAPVPA